MTVPATDEQVLMKQWKEKLSNLTELLLPTDYPRPVPLQIIEAEQTLELKESTALAILQLSLGIKPKNAVSQPPENQHGQDSTTISPFTILLAAFTILLHKYTGEEDIVVGSSSQSSNPVVLRISIKKEHSIADVVQNILEVKYKISVLDVILL